MKNQDKQNTKDIKLEIRRFEDHDLARLSMREKLSSLLRFGRLPLKEDEARPRYDVKAADGKGVLSRSNGSVLREWNLAELVENGRQVRLAIIAYKRLLRERNILRDVRNNDDLQMVVNSFGSEVVLFGFDGRTKSQVQRYQLTREISLSEIDVTLTALPKKLADAVELGKKVEENFLARLETARQEGDADKVASLEKLGAALGIFRMAPVRGPKPENKADSSKEGKKRRRNRRRGNSSPKQNAGEANAEQASAPVTPASDAPSADTVADSAASAPAKKNRRRRRNRRARNAAAQAQASETTAPEPVAVVEPSLDQPAQG